MQIKNPVLDLEPHFSARDPALLWQDGMLHGFFSLARVEGGTSFFQLGYSCSKDLLHWGEMRVLAKGPENFSSPGNLLRVGEEWLLCLQSYPVQPGSIFGGEDSRLWLMRSRDLHAWSSPQRIREEGCTASWSRSHRQIDPYLLAWKGRYWCLYKSSGCLGLMESGDLKSWQEASPQRPILSERDTPDHATVENPCVIWTGECFALFFSPCRKGRGIGLAYSDDLLKWRDIHYLDFPATPWADGGATAPAVLDMRREWGEWLMLFHGDRGEQFGSAIGAAHSQDLEHWSFS